MKQKALFILTLFAILPITPLIACLLYGWAK